MAGTDPFPTIAETEALARDRLPQHVAIIMDGNGRWAKARGLPRVEGHRAGVKTVRAVVEESRTLGIRYLTLFAFSSENWRRPAGEVSTLMGFFERYLEAELPRLTDNGIRLRAIGELDRLPPGVQRALAKTINDTERSTEMQLILAVSYGGRDEIVSACRKIAEQARNGTLRPADVSSEVLRAALYAPDLPDPDLLIRTSNEMRISNFLLWQLAYTEIVVSQRLWPEFTVEDFRSALRQYANRDRRFGLTTEQMNDKNGGTQS